MKSFAELRPLLGHVTATPAAQDVCDAADISPWRVLHSHAFRVDCAEAAHGILPGDPVRSEHDVWLDEGSGPLLVAVTQGTGDDLRTLLDTDRPY